MPERNDEVERFRRIRDQQLRARDPQKTERKIHHEIATRRRKSREPFSFRSMVSEVPKKWGGLILGGFLGFVVLVLLPNVIEHRLVDVIGILVMMFLMLIGFATGQAADAKKDLEDLIKK
jgi:hypothetical protein